MGTYAELLEDSRWKEKRLEILRRDAFKCLHCSNQKVVSNFLISPTAVGKVSRLTGSSLNFVVYDNQLKTHHRIKADSSLSYQTFMETLGNHKDATPVLLFKPRQMYCELTGLFFTNTKVHFSDFVGLDLVAQSQSRLNDIVNFLDTCSVEDFREFDWLFLKGLHVHHRYYQKKRLPWEYMNDALMTLCWSCHEELHKNEKVPYLDEEGKEIDNLTPCPKCYGAGRFPEFRHVQNGICFDCKGAKYIEFV
ncbi:hypothetical protein F5984_23730 [Rudanella paleaurantiibacter]|uniref:Uncharacterized protein n=1 Tax=Rudanella paleaurantiibacter TaxID=2614655 RepID=A0A7J5TTH1_9BACT|nr:hypothetical protein [Rudanella paleaurantiibacter]KAB7726641.1 hypothetical protein F5984_23730 [Rudanella paleaurantiibacter]